MKYVVLIMVLFAFCCAKGGEEVNEVVDILSMPEDCASDADSCCEGACMAYCQEQGLPYSKHYVNGQHCGCWCG